MATRRSSSRPQRRRLVWARYRTTSVAVVAGTAFTAFPLDTFETAYGAQLLGCTIMRVRGCITAKMVAGTNASFTVAMKVADLPGVNPEAPASSGINDDWFMYETWASVTSTPTALEPSLQLQKEVDVRARRRLDELGQRLVLAAETSSAGAGQYTFTAVLSILVALP